MLDNKWHNKDTVISPLSKSENYQMLASTRWSEHLRIPCEKWRRISEAHYNYCKLYQWWYHLSQKSLIQKLNPFHSNKHIDTHFQVQDSTFWQPQIYSLAFHTERYIYMQRILTLSKLIYIDKETNLNNFNMTSILFSNQLQVWLNLYLTMRSFLLKIS